MKLLEDRIRTDGTVKSESVLKVDAFLNHQMDVKLFMAMAEEWQRCSAGKQIDKILTIEASGIGIAAIAASVFDVPVVFAKKSQSINLDGTVYCTRIQSLRTARSSTSSCPKSSSARASTCCSSTTSWQTVAP